MSTVSIFRVVIDEVPKRNALQNDDFLSAGGEAGGQKLETFRGSRLLSSTIDRFGVNKGSFSISYNQFAFLGKFCWLVQYF